VTYRGSPLINLREVVPRKITSKSCRYASQSREHRERIARGRSGRSRDQTAILARAGNNKSQRSPCAQSSRVAQSTQSQAPEGEGIGLDGLGAGHAQPEAELACSQHNPLELPADQIGCRGRDRRERDGETEQAGREPFGGFMSGGSRRRSRFNEDQTEGSAPVDELETGPDGQLTEVSWKTIAQRALAGEPEAMGLHGVRRMMLGDLDDALAWLTRADRAGALNVLYNLGACHAMRGDRDAAQEIWLRAAMAGDARAGPVSARAIPRRGC
jgi:hypothetical protein